MNEQDSNAETLEYDEHFDLNLIPSALLKDADIVMKPFEFGGINETSLLTYSLSKVLEANDKKFLELSENPYHTVSLNRERGGIVLRIQTLLSDLQESTQCAFFIVGGAARSLMSPNDENQRFNDLDICMMPTKFQSPVDFINSIRKFFSSHPAIKLTAPEYSYNNSVYQNSFPPNLSTFPTYSKYEYNKNHTFVGGLRPSVRNGNNDIEIRHARVIRVYQKHNSQAIKIGLSKYKYDRNDNYICVELDSPNFEDDFCVPPVFLDPENPYSVVLMPNGQILSLEIKRDKPINTGNFSAKDQFTFATRIFSKQIPLMKVRESDLGTSFPIARLENVEMVFKNQFHELFDPQNAKDLNLWNFNIAMKMQEYFAKSFNANPEIFKCMLTPEFFNYMWNVFPGLTMKIGPHVVKDFNMQFPRSSTTKLSDVYKCLYYLWYTKGKTSPMSKFINLIPGVADEIEKLQARNTGLWSFGFNHLAYVENKRRQASKT